MTFGGFTNLFFLSLSKRNSINSSFTLTSSLVPFYVSSKRQKHSQNGLLLIGEEIHGRDNPAIRGWQKWTSADGAHIFAKLWKRCVTITYIWPIYNGRWSRLIWDTGSISGPTKWTVRRNPSHNLSLWQRFDRTMSSHVNIFWITTNQAVTQPLCDNTKLSYQIMAPS